MLTDLNGLNSDIVYGRNSSDLKFFSVDNTPSFSDTRELGLPRTINESQTVLNSTIPGRRSKHKDQTSITHHMSTDDVNQLTNNLQMNEITHTGRD